MSNLISKFRPLIKANLVIAGILISGCVSINAWAGSSTLYKGFVDGNFVEGFFRWMKISDDQYTYADAERYCDDWRNKNNDRQYQWELPREDQLDEFYRAIYSKEKHIIDSELLKKMGWEEGRRVWVLYDPDRDELKKFAANSPHSRESYKFPNYEPAYEEGNTNIPGFYLLNKGVFDIELGERYRKSYVLCVARDPVIWTCPAFHDLKLRDEKYNNGKLISASLIGNLTSNKGGIIEIKSTVKASDTKDPRKPWGADIRISMQSDHHLSCNYSADLKGHSDFVLTTHSKEIIGKSCVLSGAVKRTECEGQLCTIECPN